MRYETFLGTVEREAHAPTREAEWAIRATLLTLGERLSSGETHDLARRLPFILGAYIESDEDAQGFDVGEFLRRVAAREREPATVPTAERHARAVFAAIGAAVDSGELRDMASELSADYEDLLAAARARSADPEEPREEPPPPLVMSVETFWGRVAQRTGLDALRAERATDAVLEVLGERISRGEAEDLARELPRELHPALDRGEIETGGEARHMTVDEFLDRVAELESVGRDEAADHTEAVIATLREAVSGKELADLTAQLGQAYAPLFERP
jgi:uncharacterized protein (DUF2267 family)